MGVFSAQPPMPLYEYECQVCGRRFDRLQSFGDPPADTCPAGHRAVRRVVGQPAVHFTGKGFYVTDNGRGSGSGSR